tara:strand:+ start:3483 stop:3929 length:447 start_codon:yes stop_codon:yes gene_type:complete
LGKDRLIIIKNNNMSYIDRVVVIGTKNFDEHSAVVGILDKYGYSPFNDISMKEYSNVLQFQEWPYISVNLDKKTIEGSGGFKNNVGYWWNTQASNIIRELDRGGNSRTCNIGGANVEVTRSKVYFMGKTITYGEIQSLRKTMEDLKVR